MIDKKELKRKVTDGYSPVPVIHEKNGETSEALEINKTYQCNSSMSIAYLISIVVAVTTLIIWLPDGKHQDYIRGNENNQVNVANKPQNQALKDELKVALLLTFPNSGTSYTLTNTRRVTRQSYGSNYCREDRIPLYSDSDYGPLLELHDEYGLPRKYILTKTHCNGFCSNCSPKTYVVENNEEFRKSCFTVPDCIPGHSLHPVITPEEYSTYESLVGKTVHLLRNPFDNIISRFHLHVNENPAENYTKSVNGFRAYCQWINSLNKKETREFFGDKYDEYISRIPCAADFFRYSQWHNNAFEATQIWNKSSLVMYYEDYSTKYNETVSRLLEYLEQEWVSHTEPFYKSDYSDYYTEDQREAVKGLVSEYASETTLLHLKRYGFS